MLSLEGRMLGGCKLIRKIGEGGMGQVYLGEQVRVGNRLVAIKIVRPGDASHIPGATEEIERRFQREAALLGQFSHPNILPVHDSGVEDGLLYLVMQYAPEGSLSDAIHGRSARSLALPASLDFTGDIIGQVGDALQYTHARGVVHRDVKPGNVLVRIEPSGHWHALLADFGIARAQETTPQQTMVTGTFAYMAPEQFSGKFSPASDQYALAVMAYQLLAGRTPFHGDLATITHGHMYEEPPSLRELNPAVPDAVESVILRALAKDPARRYPSVADFAQALGAATAGKAMGASIAAVPAISPALAPTTPAPSESRAPASVPAGASSNAAGQGPNWPLPERSKRAGGLGRTWVAVLAAAVLLVGVVGGSGLIAQHQRQLQARATQTAQTAATHGGQATAQAHARQTAAAQTAAASAATATFTIPTATSTSPISADVTTPPPPPDGAGSQVLSDPAPNCDQPAGPTWTVDDETTVAPCAAGQPTTITTQSSSQSACIEQRTTIINNGYFSAIASAPASDAILAFRASSDASGHIANYYYAVYPASNTFRLFRIESSGQVTPITDTATLPAPLGKHFAQGVRFQGGGITMYINGQQVGTATDAAFNSGWVGLCTDGSASFSDAQAYSAQ